VEERIKTGVKGLDNLIEGGLIKNTITLLSGSPGTGKTIFGAQFVFEGLKNGETVMYVTLEEGTTDVKRIMSLHKMEPDKYIEEGKLFIFDLGEPKTDDSGKLKRDNKSFPQMTELITNILQFSKSTRIVIDSLPPLHINYLNNEDFRKDLSYFCRFLEENNLTSILITEKGEDNGYTRYGVEEYICDTFFYLDVIREAQNMKRTFEIRKMRFSQFNHSIHTAVIGPNGLDIF